jgi:hypothetical protein
MIARNQLVRREPKGSGSNWNWFMVSPRPAKDRNLELKEFGTDMHPSRENSEPHDGTVRTSGSLDTPRVSKQSGDEIGSPKCAGIWRGRRLGDEGDDAHSGAPSWQWPLWSQNLPL